MLSMRVLIQAFITTQTITLQMEAANSTIMELIAIAETIDEFASGPIPWGGCLCDHGEDGRTRLRGEKCGRCKALDRLEEIKASMNGNRLESQDEYDHKDTEFGPFH